VTASAFAAPTADGLARDHPEWGAWLAVLEATAHEAGDRAWEDAVPDEPGVSSTRLASATLAIERGVASRWVERLFRASDVAPLRDAGRRSDALGVIEAAINLDAPRLDALAIAAGTPPDAFSAVAPLAAIPWLQACERRWATTAADGGYCAVCGAWAALAEARGLEGERRLRCTRCGFDWRTPWLACPFCGNDDHTRLASLVAERTGETRKVDACRQCMAYVKTVTTLTAADASSLRLLDLATVDLDVAALDRGFTRPPGLGRPLGVRVVERPAPRRFWRR
jgi:FdhE protein